MFHTNVPINGLPQDWALGGWGGGGGVGNPRELDSVHVGREFDILNIPRVGNLTQPPSWNVEDHGMSDKKSPSSRKYPVVVWMSFPHFDVFISL